MLDENNNEMKILAYRVGGHRLGDARKSGSGEGGRSLQVIEQRGERRSLQRKGGEGGGGGGGGGGGQGWGDVARGCAEGEKRLESTHRGGLPRLEGSGSTMLWRQTRGLGGRRSDHKKKLRVFTAKATGREVGGESP